MSVIAEAFKAARAERPNTHSTPILVFLARFLGTYLPTWRKVRTAAMQLAAFGLLDYAAFQWNFIAGLVATGVSLLILEALGGSGGGRR